MAKPNRYLKQEHIDKSQRFAEVCQRAGKKTQAAQDATIATVVGYTYITAVGVKAGVKAHFTH